MRSRTGLYLAGGGALLLGGALFMLGQRGGVKKDEAEMIKAEAERIAAELKKDTGESFFPDLLKTLKEEAKIFSKGAIKILVREILYRLAGPRGGAVLQEIVDPAVEELLDDDKAIRRQLPDKLEPSKEK